MIRLEMYWQGPYLMDNIAYLKAVDIHVKNTDWDDEDENTHFQGSEKAEIRGIINSKKDPKEEQQLGINIKNNGNKLFKAVPIYSDEWKDMTVSVLGWLGCDQPIITGKHPVELEKPESPTWSEAKSGTPEYMNNTYKMNIVFDPSAATGKKITAKITKKVMPVIEDLSKSFEGLKLREGEDTPSAS